MDPSMAGPILAQAAGQKTPSPAPLGPFSGATAVTPASGALSSAGGTHTDELEKKIEDILNDPSMTNDQKTKAIIDLCKQEAESRGVSPLHVAQDMRRYGWDLADEHMYNHPALVGAHYYFKGAMEEVPGWMGSTAFGIYQAIKATFGPGTAEWIHNWILKDPANPEPWQKRPASGYSPHVDAWHSRGQDATRGRRARQRPTWLGVPLDAVANPEQYDHIA